MVKRPNSASGPWNWPLSASSSPGRSGDKCEPLRLEGRQEAEAGGSIFPFPPLTRVPKATLGDREGGGH